MNKKLLFFLLFSPAFFIASISGAQISETITINTDSIISDVSRHPTGINLDYFMDGDLDLKRSRHITEALKMMGVKYLRYPGGDKSDLNLFSVPPYDRSRPTLARTGKGAVNDYVDILKDYKDFKYDVLDFANLWSCAKN